MERVRLSAVSLRIAGAANKAPHASFRSAGPKCSQIEMVIADMDTETGEQVAEGDAVR